ncbi:MAG: amidohydrolase [Candidatus Eisenbacteria bacterium]|uniref:Amidohydrolase n=1 Tax=Eiseniibacteriota bacterium TaxID=2212470 RepID=A0A849SKF8_UNCEI|nr:amidohydrolase [Candidatus Eisenbacteria bacterium]
MNTADLIVENARLWGVPTADGPRPDSIALRAGRIVAIGTRAELAPWRGAATRQIDARSASVTPGLTDAHLHLVAWARSAGELTIDPAATLAEVVERLRAFAATRDDAVLIGRGWVAEHWSDGPDWESLEAAAAGRAVVLHSKDFHAVWASRRAFELAGLDERVSDPAGGRFDRDRHGRLTGVAREHAVRPLVALAAPERDRDLARVRDAVARLHAEGITSVHVFEGPEESRVLRRALAGAPGGGVRVLAHVPHAQLDALLSVGIESGTGDDRFRIGGVKLFADGTLGSRTAAMLEPYDDGGGIGMELMSARELRETIARAFAGGVSCAVHAIGDRAVRSTLDAVEAAGEPARVRLRVPPRIEHAQLVHALDVPRFARLGVAASMQPSHAVTDTPTARTAWASRLDTAYPWRTLETAGARLAFGSDAPVEPPSGAGGLFACVARRAPGTSDESVMSPAQRLDLERALVGFTRGPAALDGRGRQGGRLEPGAHGDLVVWDRDLFAAAGDSLAAARPLATLLAGELVHRDASVAAEVGEVSTCRS